MGFQLFVGIWDRDIPVTGAGFMYRQDGSNAPGGNERMMCGALYPPVPPETVSSPTAATVAAEASKSPVIQQPVLSPELPGFQSGTTIITMLHPRQWLPSEISLLHLGSGWPGHGGSVDKLPLPCCNFSEPLRSRCAHLPSACQMAEPLSWSPLEDERLAIEAAISAENAAAELAEATQRNMDVERRAAAKKRLQLTGSKVGKGLGRDAELSTQDKQDRDECRDCKVERYLDDSATSAFDESQVHEAEIDESFAASVPLSVAEVGSFAFEGGWYVSCAPRLATGVTEIVPNQVLRFCCQRHATWPGNNALQ